MLMISQATINTNQYLSLNVIIKGNKIPTRYNLHIPQIRVDSFGIPYQEPEPKPMPEHHQLLGFEEKYKELRATIMSISEMKSRMTGKKLSSFLKANERAINKRRRRLTPTHFLC